MLIVFSLFITVSYGAPVLISSETTVEINDDSTTQWEVRLNYSETVDTSDYFIFTRIYDVSFYMNDRERLDCSFTRKDVGSLITCKDLKKYNITSIVYRFKSNNLVNQFNEFRIFRHGLSITDNLEYFSITVKLPLGATLADKSKLKGAPIAPFEPAYGQEGSDGRKIFVKWELIKPRLGEPINLIVLYETLPFGIELGFVISILLIVIIISILSTYYFKKIKFDVRTVLDVLSEGERKVMEIIIREKKVDQRLVVRETDFSKAKVSRIIQSLSSRGLIDATPKGRTNLIVLKTPKRSFMQSMDILKRKYKISSLKLSRDQSLELTQFLTSVIDELSQKIKYLEAKDFTKIKPIKIPQKLHVLYDDVRKLYTILDDRLEEHNRLTKNLEDLVSKSKKIIEKKFGKRIEKMLEENNLDDHLSKNVIEDIINNKNRADLSYEDFWQKNKSKLLKIRDFKSIKPMIKEIQETSEKLERSIWDFKEELNKVRDEVRKSHNILVKEFYK